MAQTVNVSGMANAVTSALNEYSGMTQKLLANAVKDSARFLIKEIGDNARMKFKSTGEYAKSWKSKLSTNRNGAVSTIVYSDMKGNHASWLEHGHAKVNGGRVEGRAHISPAAEAAKKYLEDYIRAGLEKG